MANLTKMVLAPKPTRSIAKVTSPSSNIGIPGVPVAGRATVAPPDTDTSTSDQGADTMQYTAIIAALVSVTRLLPCWLFQGADMDAVDLTANPMTELGLQQFLYHMGRAGQTPMPAVTGSVTGPGNITLHAPTGYSTYNVVAGLILEFSIVPVSGTVSDITVEVTGTFDQPSPNLVASLAATPNPVMQAAPRTADLFDSGPFVMSLSRMDRKMRLILLPFQVVNGKTYLRPLCLTPIDVVTLNENDINVAISGTSAGTLTTARVLTPTDSVFMDLQRSVAQAYFKSAASIPQNIAYT